MTRDDRLVIPHPSSIVHRPFVPRPSARSLTHADELSRLGYEIDSTTGDRQAIPDRRWALPLGQNGTVRNGDDLKSPVLMNDEESSVTGQRHAVHFICELSAGNAGFLAL